MAIAVGCAGRAAADTDAGPSEKESLAIGSQNPLSKLTTLPIQNDMNLTVGNRQIQNTLNLEPNVPFGLGPVNLVKQSSLPIVWQPNVEEGTGGTFGLGDAQISLIPSPAHDGPVTWGVGPVLQLPTRTNPALGSGKFGMGPNAVLLTVQSHWVAGINVQNVWGFAGQKSVPDTNLFELEYFVYYNFADGWFVLMAPTIIADWNAARDEAWLIPVGVGGGRVFFLGHQPMTASIQVYYNALRPTGFAPVTLTLQTQFLFPQRTADMRNPRRDARAAARAKKASSGRQGACSASAPRFMADVFSSTRIYPNGDVALMGVRAAAYKRPYDNCFYAAGEGFGRFGRKQLSSGDLKLRTAGGAIGTLWGNLLRPSHWFGTGPMFDFAWGGVGDLDEFVISGYLRVLNYWRIRGSFSIGVDLRLGYVILPVTQNGIGITGPEVGLGIGLGWLKRHSPFVPDTTALR